MTDGAGPLRPGTVRPALPAAAKSKAGVVGTGGCALQGGAPRPRPAPRVLLLCGVGTWPLARG